MPQAISFLLVLPAVLAVFGPLSALTPATIPSHVHPAISPPDSSSAAAPAESKADQPDSSVHVWSLGGNGWALKIREKMLIFDYVGRTDPKSPSSGDERNLRGGYIDPVDLRSFEVYVFVTHSHPDHFDPVILEWQDQIDNITYFFGWQAGNNPEHRYLIGPRAHAQSGGVSVYTINSHQDNIPEVAYLVETDGITIYHNGDYRASYAEDFEYLRTIRDHIDIAFVIGWPYVQHQHFQQARALARIFTPTYLFAICREGDEEKSRQFAELLAEHAIGTTILYAEHRGDSFVCSRGAAE